jgi:hypothetical protein
VPAGESEDPSRRGLSDHGVLAIESVVGLQALYRKEKGGEWTTETFEPVQGAGGGSHGGVEAHQLLSHDWPGPDAAVSDSAITTKMKTNLLADAAVGALAIDVDTTAGIVSLSGFVDNEQERRRVEARSYRNAVRECPTHWGQGHGYRS